MDFGNIVKEAWRVTWRYKILWVFGLFAGAASGSGGGGGRSYSGSDFSGGGDLPPEFADLASRAELWAQEHVALLIMLAFLLVVVGLVMFVLSIAARGGLIHLVGEAEEGREVRAGAGWSAGFRNWWRLFGVGFLLWAPFVIVVIVVLLITVLPIALTGATASDAALPGILGMCGVIAIIGLVSMVLGIAISLIAELAERRVVLGGLGVIDAIKAGWQDVRGNVKNVLLMWLVTLVVGIGYGVVTVAVLVVFGAVAVAAFFGAGVFAAAVVLLPLLAVFALTGAIYATFLSSIWTILWRAMTGLGMAGSVYQAPAPSDAFPPPPEPAPASGAFPPPPPPPPAGG